jgi:hypothetical protein
MPSNFGIEKSARITSGKNADGARERLGRRGDRVDDVEAATRQRVQLQFCVVLAVLREEYPDV